MNFAKALVASWLLVAAAASCAGTGVTSIRTTGGWDPVEQDWRLTAEFQFDSADPVEAQVAAQLEQHSRVLEASTSRLILALGEDDPEAVRAAEQTIARIEERIAALIDKLARYRSTKAGETRGSADTLGVELIADASRLVEATERDLAGL
ncbi:MAG: hypothetical protein AAF682_27990 [Planctomycetota bacterium]